MPVRCFGAIALYPLFGAIALYHSLCREFLVHSRSPGRHVGDCQIRVGASSYLFANYSQGGSGMVGLQFLPTVYAIDGFSVRSSQLLVRKLQPKGGREDWICNLAVVPVRCGAIALYHSAQSRCIIAGPSLQRVAVISFSIALARQTRW